MIKVVLVLLGILASSQAQAAGETVPSFGLSPGASPNTVCIFDLSLTRPCVTIGVLDSGLHTYTSTPAAVNTNGLITAAGGILLNKTVNFGVGSPNSPANGFITGGAQNATGTCNDSPTCYLNRIIVNDSVNVSVASNGLYDWFLQDAIFPGATRNRITLGALVSVQNTPGGAGIYVAGVFSSNATADAFASGVSSVTSQNNYAVISKANYTSLGGIEQDMQCSGTCNVLYADSILVVLLSPNSVAATRENAAFLVGAQVGATPTIDTVLGIEGWNGVNPLSSTAWIIRFLPNGGVNSGLGASPNITGGIDFTKFVFSDSAFKSTGFSVDGAGNEVTNTLKTAGFTVSGLPAAGTVGRRAYVTDQLTSCPAVGAALTGGGAVKCPVFDNGTAWVSG